MAQCLQKVEIDGVLVQLFKDEETKHISGYDFHNGEYFPDPMDLLPKDFKPKRMGKTKKEIAQALEEFTDLQTLDVDSRGLRAETLERFGIKTEVSRNDGETVTAIDFPYYKGDVFKGYKVKLLDPKRFWGVGDTSNVDMFGWQQAVETGSKKIFIVEGELDVPSTYQILKDKAAGGKWADLDPAVVSPPNGAAGAYKYLSEHADVVKEHFAEIVFAFDMDEPGQKAAKKCATIFSQGGNPVLIAKMPLKDANECLTGGRSKGFATALLFKAKKPKNTRLIYGSALRELARKKPEWGESYPWPHLTNLTRGRRTKETRYWGAGVKMGKSEIVSALSAHVILEQKRPVLIIKPEEFKGKTYQMLVGKAAGRIFHDPRIEFDEEAFDEWEPHIGDRAIILDSYQFIDWDTLKDDIRYAVVTDGVRDVFLDPITALTNQITASETNELLVAMTAELSSMAMDLDFGVDIFCHLKAPPSTKTPHEMGGRVLSTQFAGSRAMMRACNYMIGIEGNKDEELPIEEKNVRTLRILEDREFGASGSVSLRWNPKTSLFREL